MLHLTASLVEQSTFSLIALFLFRVPFIPVFVLFTTLNSLLKDQSLWQVDSRPLQPFEMHRHQNHHQ